MKCVICKNIFLHINKNRKTCNKICYKKLLSINNGNNKEKIKLYCLVCNKEIITHLCKKETKKFCCMICKNKYHSTSMTGMGNPKYGTKNSNETRSKISKALTGKRQPKWKREKQSEWMNANNPMFNPIHRRKVRAYKRKQLEQIYAERGRCFIPNIGKTETKILNYIEQKENIIITRQYNICDYWVDGYDKKNNIVYEVYEKHHKYNKRQDEMREKEIIKELRCGFIKLNEEGVKI